MTLFSIGLCIIGGAVIGSLVTFIAMVIAFAAGESYEDKQ